ncbi:Leu/Ile/Val-binding protein [archaeon HR01]|nr:Leu/Ile/Val-binding protein [archaeon HR01]
MSSRGVSSALTAVAAVVALLIGLGAGIALAPAIFPPQATTITQQVGFTGKLTIGALLPLTGDLASYGENSKVTVEIAVRDVNDYLRKAGIPVTVEVVVEDTQTKPDVALTKLQSLAARGIKLFIGPQTSAEVRQIKSYADSNKLLLVSQSSTAPALAIPDDYVYRFCPDDTIQGPAISAVAKALGVKAVVQVWRGDAWGDGLQEATKKSGEALGFVYAEGIRYSPEAKEFSAEVRLLNDRVAELLKTYKPEEIAVELIAFNEAVTFISQAADYPDLARVRWLGSDGTAQLDELIKDPKAAAFSVQVNWINPIFAPTESGKYTKLVEEAKARLGRVPDSYAIAAYDEVWVLTLAVLQVGKYDAEAVKSVLADVANNFFGASGWIVLNAAGDRATADYSLWAVRQTAGGYTWEKVGVYSAASGSVSFTG